MAGQDKNVGGRPRKIGSPEEFDRLVDDYVAQCQADDEPITITGMTLALGFVAKQSLYDYAEYDGFSDSVKRAQSIVENAYEKRLSGHAATGAIFALKNFGWKDRQEVESTNRHIITDEAMQPEEWESEYTR